VALLIILWWQRGSLRMRQDVLPLMPWVAIGVASGLFTAWIERTSIGASGSQFAFSLLERTLIAGRAWVFYLRSLAWPSDLVFIYPRWTIDAGDWRAYLYPLAALALLLAAWAARTRSRAPLAALLFFSVTLAPALGFVNVYPFRFSFVADHFQYLAGLGVMALAAAAADAVARRARLLPASAAAIVLPLAASAVLAPLTWRQAREYTDPATLYRETLERNPGAWLAHLNLGVLEPHDPAGIARAIGQYQAALAIQPDEPQVNNNIGTSLMELGRYEEAARFHRDAVRFAPGYAEAHWNLGVDLHHLGRTDEAMTSYRTALRLKPDLPGAHFDLAVALDESGRRAEALAEVDAALRLDPAYPEATTLRRHLSDLANDSPRSAPSTTAAPGPARSVRDLVADGYAAIAAKRWAEAIGTFEGVLARQADAKDARRGLATALWQSGRPADAEREIRRALQLDTSDAAAHDLLGSVLLVSGRRAEAVDAYRRALLVDKGTLRPEILNDLGVALAQMGQMEQARNAFQEAVQLKPNFDAARANLERASGLGPRR
jgi:tetratricopeptide (TPR) repeat protein